jgi:archaellum component FlaC
MNKAKRILTISEAQVKELSPADLNELEEDLDKIIEQLNRLSQEIEEPGSGDRIADIRELVGGIKYILGLAGSGRA